MAEKPAHDTVTFVANNLKPDTKLTVYSTVFQVHAVILRLYSGFFRKFLVEKKSAVTSGGSEDHFTYHLVVKNDGDVWGLQPADGTIQNEKEWPSVETCSTRICTFEILLEAFYRRRHVFENVDQLADLISVADYYLALPVISSFVESNLLISTKLLEVIPLEAPRFLSVAYAARSASLFKESFIHTVGIWSRDEGQREIIRDTIGEKLTDLVVRHHGTMSEKMCSLFRFSLACQEREPVFFAYTLKQLEKKLVREVVLASLSWEDRISPENDTSYCRSLHSAVLNPSEDDVEAYRKAKSRPKYEMDLLRKSLCQAASESIHKYTSPLLKNNLHFEWGRSQDGSSNYDYFLCTDLPDDHIPWDVTELDW